MSMCPAFLRTTRGFRTVFGAGNQTARRTRGAERPDPPSGPTWTPRAQSAAEGFLDQTAEDLLTGRDVTVAGSPSSIEVTVTGTSISLFPGLSGWAVTQSAVGPVERPTS